MSFLFKLLLGGSVLALCSYLILEILKLRNKVKSLTLRLSTTENFNSNIPSSSDIQTEIDAYKQELTELHSLDTMVDQLKEDIHNEYAEESDDNTQPIITEDEHIDYDTIENEMINNSLDSFTEQLTTTHGTTLQVEELTGESAESVELTGESVELTGESTESVELTGDSVESIETIETVEEITESDMQFLLDKYNKNTLKKLCSTHNLTKGGSKKDLILKLLKKNVLQKELPNNNILNSLELSPKELQAHVVSVTSEDTIVDTIVDTMEDTMEDTIAGTMTDINVDIDIVTSNTDTLEFDSIEEISTQQVHDHIQNIPIDSLLYNLRKLNEVSNGYTPERMNSEQF